jgi:hypothetical protein
MKLALTGAQSLLHPFLVLMAAQYDATIYQPRKLQLIKGYGVQVRPLEAANALSTSNFASENLMWLDNNRRVVVYLMYTNGSLRTA